MSGREWLESVRTAALEIKKLELIIMESQTVGNSSSANKSGGSQSVKDRTASIAIASIEAQAKLFDLLDTIFQGEKIAHGVSLALGWKTGEAVRLRYVEALSWSEVAEGVECSTRHAHRLVHTAINYIDTVGPQRALEGLGIAED